MSSIVLNPGAGGSAVATDVFGGDHYQLVKTTGNRQSYWPGYTGPSSTDPKSVNIDDGGALVTRGAVTTDEGTFRCNFANSSLWVSIGSVTVSGATVTGTGFLASDCHKGDYFKIAADADSLALQIDSIDSDTQITLVGTYAGSASGTGNRALLFQFAGTGGSLSVASGQLTVTAGTTAGAVTGVSRYVDYGPLVARVRGSISQRIANQSFRTGLRENASTPRWFAWFLLDGTTNTTVKCQTGRNPTGAPSAAETQETTITLPNGVTTATARDYRVELLTESVRFYVDGVLMAEHTTTIPHQHDEMALAVEFVNGTTPATSTTATLDYVTCKNHNKLEIGVMSDAEKIVASAPPLVPFSYNVAGVIAINTDLIVIDCLQLRGLSIQCTSMGTTGVVTPAFSNDGVNWVSQFVVTTAGVAAATFNAAGLWTTPVYGRYFRLRLTTATTAGTTTLAVTGFQSVVGQPAALGVNVGGTVSVSGTVSTNINAGTNAIGDVGVQYRANATGAATISKFTAAASTNGALILTGARRLIGWSLTNTTASFKYFRIYNKATAPTVGTDSPTFVIGLPPNSTTTHQLPGGMALSLGLGISCTGAVADLDTTVTAANDVIGAIYYS